MAPDKRNRPHYRLALLLISTLSVCAAEADEPLAGFDGEQSLICAAQTVVACTEDKGCMEGEVRHFELPSFLRFEFASKKVRASESSVHSAESTFDAVEISDTNLIVQGVDSQHGWSANINRMTGRLVVSSIGPQVSYMIFGVCTLL